MVEVETSRGFAGSEGPQPPTALRLFFFLLFLFLYRPAITVVAVILRVLGRVRGLLMFTRRKGMVYGSALALLDSASPKSQPTRRQPGSI